MHNGVQVNFPQEVYDGTKPVCHPSFFDGVHNMSMKYMMDGVIWLGILRVISYEKLFRQLSAIRKPVKILRHAFLWTSKIISRQFVIL